MISVTSSAVKVRSLTEGFYLILLSREQLRKGELVILKESESNFSILVPLFLPDLDQHELQAMACLGRREKNRGYSSDDKKALRDFGGKVGIAIYRLRNWQRAIA